jgi:hypothetical protein
MWGSRVCRVVVFRRPQGPWRRSLRQAHADAIELGLGSYDEDGTFFITVPADIEWADAQVISLCA